MPKAKKAATRTEWAQVSSSSPVTLSLEGYIVPENGSEDRGARVSPPSFLKRSPLSADAESGGGIIGFFYYPGDEDALSTGDMVSLGLLQILFLLVCVGLLLALLTPALPVLHAAMPFISVGVLVLTAAGAGWMICGICIKTIEAGRRAKEGYIKLGEETSTTASVVMK